MVRGRRNGNGWRFKCTPDRRQPIDECDTLAKVLERLAATASHVGNEDETKTENDEYYDDESRKEEKECHFTPPSTSPNTSTSIDAAHLSPQPQVNPSIDIRQVSHNVTTAV